MSRNLDIDTGSQLGDDTSTATGTYNLCHRGLRGPPADTTRPISILSPRGQRPGESVRRVLNLPATTPGTTPAINEEYIDNDKEEDDFEFQTVPAATPPEHDPSTLPLRAPAEARSTSLLHLEASRLVAGATATSFHADLHWQQEVRGEPAKIRAFRSETLQQLDLRVFAYMRPTSPFIHLLHSGATFYVPGGDADYRGKDVAFVGDKDDFQAPTAVVLGPESPWKWITKPVVMNEAALEL